MKTWVIVLTLTTVLLLSGCHWKNYEGCAFIPTNTEVVYKYKNPEEYTGKYNAFQKWWEYKSGEYGFWYNGSERGNTPWWAYPKDIVAIPCEIGLITFIVLTGGEIP